MGRKAILILTVFLFIIVALTSCQQNYSGEHRDLYTVAINSLLWNKGMSSQADKLCDPSIVIIEKDIYGRVLFQYTEKSFNDKVAFSAILVLQSTNDNCVYYYEDCNFICIEKPPHNVEVSFDEHDINALKELNDWNKAINLNKCVKKNISNEKEKVPVEEDLLDAIFSAYEGYYSNISFHLTNDNYGRSIVYSCVLTTENDMFSKKYLVLLFNPDCTYSILEITSLYDYQKELGEFKSANHWNQPFN